MAIWLFEHICLPLGFLNNSIRFRQSSNFLGFFYRCTLIEDSRETKSIKKSLTKQKSTTNLNLWRRFSRKIIQNPDKGLSDIQNPDKRLGDIQNQDKGLDDIQSNPEENMDAPNSPWRRKSEPTVSFQENIGKYLSKSLSIFQNKRTG